MKPVQFRDEAYLDYIEWAKENKEIFDKINTLIIDIDRNLFKGLGKPEPLKKNLLKRKLNDISKGKVSVDYRMSFNK